MSQERDLDVGTILNRLRVGAIAADPQGLEEVYSAWCLAVPFDNLYKTNALFRAPGTITPYVDAPAFFDNWLAHGIGGTCWPHGNALFSLLFSLGFDVKRATASMFDLGDANHATAFVHFNDGSAYIVDNSLQSLKPVLVEEAVSSAGEGGIYYSEVEFAEDELFVHGTNPPMPGIFFRVLERDVPGERYCEQWEIMSGSGPFNSGLHIRRNYPDRIVVMRGSGLFTYDKEGLKSEILDAEGIKHHLRSTMRISQEFVEEWSKSGALEASLAPPGPMPQFPERTPPSRRQIS